MKIISSRLIKLVVPAACLGLVSCESGDPLADLEKEGSVYGGGKPTTFTVQADGALRIKDLAVAGETIRVARKLNKSEAEILRSLAQKKFDGFMVTALEELRPKYDRKKQEVRKATTEKSAAVKATAAKQVANLEAAHGPKSPEVAAVQKQAETQIAQIAKTEEQQLAMIDADWHKEAAAKVRSSYGSQFAVPVKAAGGEAVVAFAKIDDNGVMRASDTAYALNTSPSAFLAAAKQSGGAAVTHQGSQSVVISSTPAF